jgi:hypothetical protein
LLLAAREAGDHQGDDDRRAVQDLVPQRRNATQRHHPDHELQGQYARERPEERAAPPFRLIPPTTAAAKTWKIQPLPWFAGIDP